MGSTLIALSLEGLVNYSDIAVVGTPTKMETVRDERGRIVRAVTFEVDEYVKGTGASRIVVRLNGGTLDGMAEHVPGEIALDLGAPVLLFLEIVNGAGQGVFLVTGMAQGRFHIVTDKNTGERFVSRMLGKLNLVGAPEAGDVFGLARGETSTFVPMKEFLQRIKDLTGKAE